MPAAALPVERVVQLLELAEAAMEGARRAVRAGARCGATDAERARARAAAACLDRLGSAAARFDAIVAELCAAFREGRAAALTAVQIAALEGFASCAAELSDAAPGRDWLSALVGTALPAAGAIALAL